MTEATATMQQGDIEFDRLGDFPHGGKQARTVIYLSPKYRLILRTNKVSSGGVSTVASVVTLANGFETHRMYHDFNKTLVWNRNLRATAGNVASQHATVDAKEIIEQCIAHYAAKGETLN